MKIFIETREGQLIEVGEYRKDNEEVKLVFRVAVKAEDDCKARKLLEELQGEMVAITEKLKQETSGAAVDYVMAKTKKRFLHSTATIPIIEGKKLS